MDENENERLVLFTDAVIAITITLLVLELRLPETVGRMSDEAIWDSLREIGPRLLAYLISFLVTAVFWMNHRQKFRLIVRSSGGLIWSNFLFLLTISLLPLTTSLIAESGGTLATAIYAAMMAATGLSLALVWTVAGANGLIDEKVGKADQRRILWRSIASSAVFAVSIPLAIAHSDVAKYFWLLLIPVTLFRGFGRARRARGPDGNSDTPR